MNKLTYVTLLLFRAHQGQVLENMLTMDTPSKGGSKYDDEDDEELEIPAPATLQKKTTATPSPAKTPAMNWWKHLDDDTEGVVGDQQQPDKTNSTSNNSTNSSSTPGKEDKGEVNQLEVTNI